MDGGQVSSGSPSGLDGMGSQPDGMLMPQQLPAYGGGGAGAGRFLTNFQMQPSTFQPRAYMPPAVPQSSGLLDQLIAQRQRIAPPPVDYGLLSAGGASVGPGGVDAGGGPVGVGADGGNGMGGPAQGGVSGGPGEGDSTSGSDGGGGGGGGK